MKNTIKLLGIIALVAIIGFSFTACDDGSGGGGDSGGPAFLGETLNLSGQVYLTKWNETANGGSLSYQAFNGNVDEFEDYYGGTGKITNGKFSYSTGTPKSSSLETIDIEDEFGWGYDNFTTSRQTVKGTVIWGFYTDDPAYSYLIKSNGTETATNNSYSGTYESVIFVYVENDVTLSGKGKTEQWKSDDDPDFDPDYDTPYTETYTTSNFNFTLKTGWNAVHYKRNYSESVQGSWENPTRYTSTGSETMSLKNPSLRWVLSVDEDYLPFSPPASHTPLTNGQWANGSLANNNSVDWYSFTVTAGTEYRIWWNDEYDGNDTKTADVAVSAWYNNGTPIFIMEDRGWYYPQSFTASSNGTVYIKVTPEWGYGTYGIVFSSNNSRPNVLGNILITPSYSTIDPETILKDGQKKSKVENHGLKPFRQIMKTRLRQK